LSKLFRKNLVELNGIFSHMGIFHKNIDHAVYLIVEFVERKLFGNEK